jgi:hypothetical protein
MWSLAPWACPWVGGGGGLAPKQGSVGLSKAARPQQGERWKALNQPGSLSGKKHSIIVFLLILYLVKIQKVTLLYSYEQKQRNCTLLRKTGNYTYM